jgi:hypothetical protein
MPGTKEIVANKGLSGTEMQKIIRADFEKLLEGEGLLSAQMAYGRVSYDIRLRLHTGNPYHPESEISISSRVRSVQEIEANPAMAAVETPPLANPPDDAIVVGTEVARVVDSPNVERIRIGEPIPVSVKQMDGTVSTQHIQYPKDPDAGDGNVAVRDVTDEALVDWKVKQGTEPPTKSWWGAKGGAAPSDVADVQLSEMDTTDPT